MLFEFSDPEDVPGEGMDTATGVGLKRVELLEDPMYLALPREHPLAGGRTLRLADLHGQAWVQTSKASPCARHVVRCCHVAGFEPNVAFESDDYQTVQGLVAAGVGVALIPELALASVREDIAVRTLSPHPPVRRVIAALPGRVGVDTRLIPAASAMLRLLEEAAAGRNGDARRRRALAETGMLVETGTRAGGACLPASVGFGRRSHGRARRQPEPSAQAEQVLLEHQPPAPHSRDRWDGCRRAQCTCWSAGRSSAVPAPRG